MGEVISRKEALAKGLKRYFTGKPCKYGHLSERYNRGECIECNLASSKLRQSVGMPGNASNRANKLRQRGARITTSEFRELWSTFDLGCQLCGSAFKNNQDAKVDHDHKTGLVRGLICTGCNRTLHALDNLEWRKKAEAYIERHENLSPMQRAPEGPGRRLLPGVQIDLFTGMEAEEQGGDGGDSPDLPAEA